MENLTLTQIRDAVIVLLAVMAFVVLLGNVIKTTKGWKQPADNLEAWRVDVNTKLDKDNRRLNDLEEGNRQAALAKLEKAAEGRFSPLNYCSREQIDNEIRALKEA